ncbi:MAG TPA: DUF4397 domain-containing protein [Chitinophagaceae bacterium]|nr:DUF4397 domain-containing protein [Chitinophagaceae bacterium]
MTKKTLMLPAIAGLFLTILFISCKKNNTVTSTPAAKLMAFNLAPDQSAVAFSVSGNALTSLPLAYDNYTGSYVNVLPGSHDITAYDQNSSTQLATVSQSLTDSAYYSVFLVGASGSYKNVVAQDNFDSLSDSSGQAYVRYINAIVDSTGQPGITVTSGGNNLFDSTAAFATVTNFKGVAPGDVSVTINTESATPLANRTFSVEQGKIYTILLVGEPAATDTSKAVQIKYITNGQLTP